MSTDPNASSSVPQSSPSASEPDVGKPSAEDTPAPAPAPTAPEAQGEPSTENGTEATPAESAPSVAASGETVAEDKPRSQPLKIGSQRPGTPKIKAQPQLPPVPTLASDEPAASVGDMAEADSSGESAEATDAEEAGDDDGTRKIGSQRPGSPKIKSKAQFESKATPEQPPAERVPLPNLRRALSADMEEELAASMADISLDNIVESQSREAELEVNSHHQAKVSRVQAEEVFVDLGQRNQGVLPMLQLSEPPEVGQTLEVVITRYDAADGLYQVALPGAAAEVGDWDSVAEGMVVEARITGHNKGGLECQVNNLRGFIPASQVAQYRIEDFSEFVDQSLTCLVTEVNPQRRNLVLSRRSLIEREQAEAKEKLLAELAPGQVREGIVRNIRDFGAFVDLGGVDGLLHVSQLSWQRVNHPNEVLELGQKVKVKIQKIDPETKKISLAMKDLMASPWDSAKEKYYEGLSLHGKVTKVADFGAFVELEPGVEGLVHISELAHHRVFRTSDIVKEGEEVEVKILSFELDKQRISLSMKAMQSAPEREKKEEPEEEFIPPPQPSKRTGPLKGGLKRDSGGEGIGLNW